MLTKLKDILAPEELLKLQNIINDKTLLNGLKKIFLSSVYYNGTLEKGVEPEPRRNFVIGMLYTEDMSVEYNVPNEQLGAKVRASIEAIRLLEQGFKELENLKDKPAIEIETSNIAR